MSVHTVTRSRMDAALAPLSTRDAFVATQIEAMLFNDTATAQRTLTALVAKEVVGASVFALPNDDWAVSVPASGDHPACTVVVRVVGSDVDHVSWELFNVDAKRTTTHGSAPVVVENMGVRPQMVHELLEQARAAGF